MLEAYRWRRAVLLVALWVGGCGDPPVENPELAGLSAEHQRLVQLLGSLRPVLPRLTGFPFWRECASSAGCPPLSVASRETLSALREVAFELERQLARPRGASALALHAEGARRLVVGDEAGLDLAVELLERAFEGEPERADVASDLAAAFLLRGQAEDRLEDRLRAYELATQALELEPGHAAAAFNQALALETLHLRNEAAAAWEKVAGEQRGTGWGDEAAARAVRLRTPFPVPTRELFRTLAADAAKAEELRSIALSAPVAAQDYAFEEGLAAWIEAREPGEVAVRWSTLHILAAAVEERAGDRTLRVVVAQAEQARGEAATALAVGFKAYCEAARVYGETRWGEGGEQFHRAGALLSAASSPLAAWARYYAAVARFRAAELGAAQRELESLRQLALRRAMPILDAHCSWMLGLIAVEENRVGPAGSLYQAALTGFERAHAVQEAGWLHELLAEQARFRGDRAAFWQHLGKALEHLDLWPRASFRRGLVIELANRAAATSLPRAARLLEARAVAEALASNQPAILADAYAERARARSAQGDVTGARADLAAARELLPKIQDEKARPTFLVRVLLAEASALTDEGPAPRLDRLGQAAAILAQRGLETHLPPVLFERAKLLRSAGELAAAERELGDALAIVEKGGGSIEREWSRSLYLASVREIYDAMVGLQLEEKRDVPAAFLWAERARAHEYLTGGLAAESGTMAHRLAELRARLGTNAAVVAYWQLPEKLLAWVVTERGVVLQELTPTREQLQRSVSRARVAMRRGGLDERAFAELSALHAQIWAPIAGLLDEGAAVYVEADGALHGLPFPVLFDRANLRFLAQERDTVKLLGSAVLNPPAPEAAGPLPPTALLVGDPAFDAERFPHLARLPGARAEAQAASDMILERTLLVGDEATKARFLSELDRHQLLLFAGHSYALEEGSDPSFLLLAPSSRDGDGSVSTQDLERVRLRRLRSVLLSSCDTVAAGGELGAVRGIARAFLAAGATEVVGTQDAIEDRHAASFTLRVVDRLRQGGVTARAAVQKEQREALAKRAKGGGGEGAVPGVAAWMQFEVFVRWVGI